MVSCQEFYCIHIILNDAQLDLSGLTSENLESGKDILKTNIHVVSYEKYGSLGQAYPMGCEHVETQPHVWSGKVKIYIIFSQNIPIYGLSFQTFTLRLMTLRDQSQGHYLLTEIYIEEPDHLNIIHHY